MGKKNQRQFRRGRRLKSMAALSKVLDAGRYVYITYGMSYVRLVHPSWVISMQYRLLQQFVLNGKVHAAINQEKKWKTEI